MKTTTTIASLWPWDLEDCAVLGRVFFDSTQIPGEFNPEAFIRAWRRFFTIGAARVFGARRDGRLVGAVGGLVATNPNTGEPWAQELFWFVDPGSRGMGVRLLRVFLDALQDEGIAWVTMVALEGPMREKVGRLYERLGMTRLETHYVGRPGTEPTDR